jgi:hypothetical protein
LTGTDGELLRITVALRSASLGHGPAFGMA